MIHAKADLLGTVCGTDDNDGVPTTDFVNCMACVVGVCVHLTYVSLHTERPERSQDEHEASYTGYARQGVPALPLNNKTQVCFGQMTGGVGGELKYFGLGKSPAGSGNLLLCGQVTPSIFVDNGVTPTLEIKASVG